jgi:hypothetical protein
MKIKKKNRLHINWIANLFEIHFYTFLCLSQVDYKKNKFTTFWAKFYLLCL